MSKTGKSLLVLNASAGSGKTYRLVKEFISLLINEEQLSFGSILAMTFTNKAAYEMKERIISALDEIGNSTYFNNKQDQLKIDLSKELNISEQEVELRCRKVLQEILHQYEDFNISTIDKFNLRLIKSFSRDLDLPSDFEVVMDEEVILEQVVDNLLNELGEKETHELGTLIIRYAQSKLEDGETWNIRSALIRFGSILKSERNKKLIEILLASPLTLKDRDHLYAAKKTIELKYQKLIDELLPIHEATNYDVVKGKSRPRNAVQKLLDISILKNSELMTEKFIEAYLDTDIDSTNLPTDLHELLLRINHFWDNNKVHYHRLLLALSNFFNIALLKYIAEAMSHIRTEEHIIRISEFNTLISQLILNESAPFIYERVGTKFQHFLLDEFQDTSHLQWLNLVPLIHNSLGEGYKNLIVGDPKQSIYRFNNGLAEQFVELPGIYNPSNDPKIASWSDYFKLSGEMQQLNDNWRSSPEIVNFNNEFFAAIKNLVSDKARSFYNSTTQNIRSKQNGYVQIDSAPIEEEINPVNIVLSQVEECLSTGVKGNQICILGRTNSECNNYAIALTKAGHKVVSSDSLLIYKDPAVKLTLAYLQLRYKPSGKTEQKFFAETYYRYHKLDYDNFEANIDLIEKDGKEYRIFNEDRFITSHFKDKATFFFKYDSLYDLIQGFYLLMKWNELANPYIHHLADIAFIFEQKKGPDLKLFLGEFEQNKKKIAVQIPSSEDAIIVMTIHKSKGLEFPVVIIPDIDFKLGNQKETLIDSGDFIFYKKPSSKSLIPEIQEYYDIETEQIFIDALNICYVAMTRPERRLYVSNYFKDKNSFGHHFHEALKQLSFASLTDDVIEIRIGTTEAIQSKSTSTVTDYHPKNISDKLWFPDIALQDTEELLDHEHLSDERQFGLQFHLLLSLIEDSDAISTTIDKLIQSGEIDVKFKDEIASKAFKLFDDKLFQKLNSNALSKLTEQDIIIDQATVIRPDKVIKKQNETIILDYKTGIPNQKDEKQVKRYKQIFEQMGYPNVSCYLLYSSLDEIRQIA